MSNFFPDLSSGSEVSVAVPPSRHELSREDLRKLPETRKEALKKGYTSYFTGRPCAKGHYAARTMRADCAVCLHEYQTAYYQNHKEEIYHRRSVAKAAKAPKASKASKKPR